MRQNSNKLRISYDDALWDDPCAYCGSVGGTILDHIVPRSQGGSDEWWNKTSACKACNSAKAGRSLLAFLGARANRSLWDAVFVQRKLWNQVGT